MNKLDEMMINKKKQNKMILYIMKVFSFFGDYNLIWTTFCLYFIFFDDKNIGITAIFLMMLIYALSSGFFKSIFRRKRPYEEYSDLNIIIKHPYGSSFPSEHTATGIGVSLYFLYHNTFIGILGLFIAFVIAISRMYLKVNYFTDVIVGVLIGSLITVVYVFLISNGYLI